MKKKLLLCVSLIALLVFVLALAVSAESRIVKLDSDPGLDCDDSLVSYLDGDYAPYTPVTWASVTGGLDTESRVVLTDGNGGYYVFPSWYIYRDEAYETGRNNNHNGYRHCLKFERLNAAIAKFNEENGTEHFASFTSHTANLVRIEMVRGVASIAQDTQKFESCTLLKEVRFPSTLSVINAQNCFTSSGIEKIDLSMTSITYLSNAFASGTKSLGEVILPATCTSISQYAFQGSSLTSINTENVTSYGQHVFTGTTRLEGFVIAEGVTTIPVNFVQNATALKTLVIPSTIKTFYGYSFQGCTALQSVEIKASLQSIEANAFASCSALTDVIFRGTVKTLGQSVFSGCSSLEAIVLPDGLTAGGHDMFSGCNKLTTITIPRTMEKLCERDGNCQYAFHGKGNPIIYTGTTDSTFYTEQLYPKYGSKIQIKNHCEVYYGGNHQVSGEVQKVFLGQAFASDYKIFTECGRECGTENVIETIGQLIHLKGYSTSEIPGNKAMMHSFIVDKSLVSKYQELFADLKFGVLAVGENTSSPFNGSLIDAQGNKAHEKIAMSEFTNRDFDEIEIKVGGIDGYEDRDLYFCGYVIGGENVYYIENDAIKTQAETVTYNDVCAILTGTGNEEENENV